MTAFLDGLRQPDPRSCGAAVLVAAQMLHDPAYAASMTADRFAGECLAMHRRTTGPVDVRGRTQLPWPRALGTPPWAVATQLQGTTGVPWRTVPMLTGRARTLERIRAATAIGHPVPLYVGSRWLPRHVVLVLDPDLTTYEPASGRRVAVSADDAVAGTLSLAGWSTPWFAVLPGPN